MDFYLGLYSVLFPKERKRASDLHIRGNHGVALNDLLCLHEVSDVSKYIYSSVIISRSSLEKRPSRNQRKFNIDLFIFYLAKKSLEKRGEKLQEILFLRKP